MHDEEKNREGSGKTETVSTHKELLQRVYTEKLPNIKRLMASKLRHRVKNDLEDCCQAFYLEWISVENRDIKDYESYVLKSAYNFVCTYLLREVTKEQRKEEIRKEISSRLEDDYTEFERHRQRGYMLRKIEEKFPKGVKRQLAEGLLYGESYRETADRVGLKPSTVKIYHHQFKIKEFVLSLKEETL